MADHGACHPASDPRIEFFNRLAPAWDATGPSPVATLKQIQSLQPQLHLKPGQDLLELGCGTGQITGWLARCIQPGRVVAADFSPAMLERARDRGVEAEFRLLDICVEQSVTELFDVVLCFHSFPHFRDPTAALRQINRLLKPGGQLLVLHLAGSAHLNAFHRQLAAPVCQDHLPAASDWPALLQPVSLNLVEALDHEGLFLVRALKPTPCG